MLSRREFIDRTLMLPGIVLAGCKKADFPTQPPNGLQAYATQKNLFFGTEVTYQDLTNDQKLQNSVITESGIIVPGFEMKWAALRPSADRYDYTKADWLVNFARQNKLLMRGHTLCWHQSLPAWFSTTVNASNAEFYLTEHIRNVAGHFAGKLHSWDVVNEAVQVSDRRPNGLRNSPWYQFLGEEYIEIAFRTAAKADPTALLAYNDFQLETTDAQSSEKRAAVLALLQRLKRKAVPIHLLGIQAHLFYDRMMTSFDAAIYKKFLSDVASLGLKIIITELDVRDNALPAELITRDSGVAKAYQNFLSVVLEEPAVIGILTWGLSDKYSWLINREPRSDGQPVRPLPLDANLRRKTAWIAVANSFGNTFKR